MAFFSKEASPFSSLATCWDVWEIPFKVARRQGRNHEKQKKPKKTEAPAPREPQVQSPPHLSRANEGTTLLVFLRCPIFLDHRRRNNESHYWNFGTNPTIRWIVPPIFYQIQDSGLLRLPKPMKYPNMKRSLMLVYVVSHVDYPRYPVVVSCNFRIPWVPQMKKVGGLTILYSP